MLPLTLRLRVVRSSSRRWQSHTLDGSRTLKIVKETSLASCRAILRLHEKVKPSGKNSFRRIYLQTNKISFLNDISGISYECDINHLSFIRNGSQTILLRLFVERIKHAGAINLFFRG